MTPIAAPLQVNAGRRRITIENDYYEPLERVITVPEGGEGSAVLVEVDLRAEGTRVLRFAPDRVQP